MTIRTTLLAAALALAAAAPASAERVVLVAAGDGATTTCIVQATATDHWTQYNAADGTTSCTVAVEQSGQVRGHVPGVSTGSLCSGFTRECHSSVMWHDFDEQDAGVSNTPESTYEMAVRAPNGQGWVSAPAQSCSGIGTDNLRCTFTSRALLLWVST